LLLDQPVNQNSLPCAATNRNMEREYIEDSQFDNIDFSAQPLSLAVYENCCFVQCHFADLDLSQIHFADCTFTNCNLSGAKLHKTALRQTKFVHCKMLGLHFDQCHPVSFEVSFEHCTLQLSSFYQMQLKQTPFAQCNLQEVDFSRANLTGAVFAHCDLTGAVFDETVLEKADFSTAINYTINPQQNLMKKAKFSLEGLPGLLRQFGIEVVEK
jgi:fluoroquinolone resistance protein